MVLVLSLVAVGGCVPPPPDGGGSSGSLALSLSSSLDGDGASKATTITSAQLLDTSGPVAATATIAGGVATFDLSGVTAGDYFILVNNLADDLVPTRIDDASADTTQLVGRTLETSTIGNAASPTYKFRTFAKGQAASVVVKYSDGTAAPPERYAYARASLGASPQRLDLRTLGTDAQLSTFTPGGGGHTFSTWIFSHGAAVNASCAGCHGDLATHPANWSTITTGNGWCFRCHYGQGGGFEDTTQ